MVCVYSTFSINQRTLLTY